MTYDYEIGIECGDAWYFSNGSVPVPPGVSQEQIRDAVAAACMAEWEEAAGPYEVTDWRVTVR